MTSQKSILDNCNTPEKQEVGFEHVEECRSCIAQTAIQFNTVSAYFIYQKLKPILKKHNYKLTRLTTQLIDDKLYVTLEIPSFNEQCNFLKYRFDIRPTKITKIVVNLTPTHVKQLVENNNNIYNTIDRYDIAMKVVHNG